MRRWAMCVAVAAVCAVAGAQPRVSLRLVTGGLGRALFLCSPPGDAARLFVVEQGGKIRVIDRATGQTRVTPFLDLSGDVLSGGEAGLLGLAFHPDYSGNGRFYVYFSSRTETWGAGATVVVEFRAGIDPDVADAASGRLVLRIPSSISNHNAGWMGFGPDGLLYIASGERGSSPNAQVLTSNLRGKILRLDVNGPDGDPGTSDDDGFPGDADKNYQIPASNPFAGCGADGEILLYGLRNPWRCSFDRLTNEFWIGDVGDGTPGEIDVVRFPQDAGKNLRWPCREGLATHAGTCSVPPVPCVDHGALDPVVSTTPWGCSLTGGYVYRGCDIPELRGTYIYSDYCEAWVRGLRLEGGVVSKDMDFGVAPLAGLSSLGEDSQGELYFMSIPGPAGEVYKLVPTHVHDCNANGISDACEGLTVCESDLDDGSGTGHPDCAVTIEDLLYFLNAYEQGAREGDLDDGSGTGTWDAAVTIEDLLYFLARYEGGC